jgi:hypothetical protein
MRKNEGMLNHYAYMCFSEIFLTQKTFFITAVVIKSKEKVRCCVCLQLVPACCVVVLRRSFAAVFWLSCCFVLRRSLFVPVLFCFCFFIAVVISPPPGPLLFTTVLFCFFTVLFCFAPLICCFFSPRSFCARVVLLLFFDRLAVLPPPCFFAFSFFTVVCLGCLVLLCCEPVLLFLSVSFRHSLSFIFLFLWIMMPRRARVSTTTVAGHHPHCAVITGLSLPFLTCCYVCLYRSSSLSFGVLSFGVGFHVGLVWFFRHQLILVLRMESLAKRA